MIQFLRSGILLIVACGALGLGLQAQIVIYATDFADDQGWTLSSSSPPVVWAVDASPASVLGSPAWRSAPNSLNYNNGFDYISPGGNWGIATSPPIDLSIASGNVNFGFWCNWSTEGGPCIYDARKLLISNDGFQTTLYSICYIGHCGPAGLWHFHSMPLSTGWGTIQIRYSFATGDSSHNGYAGWFIDDLSVTSECLTDAHYCTPKLNSLGCSPTIFTTGMPSLSGTGQAFRIWSGGVLNQKVGLMLWSRSPASSPFGGGTLCVAAPIARTAAQNSGGSSLPAMECDGFYVFQFTPAMMSQAGLLAGDDIYSQYWSRDNGFPPPDNVGLTAGVQWEVCP
jgi:hypothetical protein